MSDIVIDEVLFALQRERDLYESNGAEKEAAQFDGYCDAIQNGRAIAHGTRLSPEEVERTRQALLAVTSPDLLRRLLPYSRQQAAYRSTMNLAGQVGRVAKGKPARKLFGIFE